MSKYLNLTLLFFLINLHIIISLRYPILNNLITSTSGSIKSILIKSKEQFLDYILNQKYIITLTEFTLYEKEPEIISIFDKVSSYKVLNNWNFLKIKCYEQSELCNILSTNIENKSIPSIKIYIKSHEFKTAQNIMNIFTISELLEFLYKLSSNPIIDIKNNNIIQFYESYTRYSPIIYYDESNTEFISCIKLLSNKKYFSKFFFGIFPLNKTELKTQKEKIVFDNENMPISKTWDGDCDDIDIFLEQNTYPLLDKVNNQLMNTLSIDKKILVVLIGYNSFNDKINKFINNEFKKLAYMHRDLVFAYDFNDNLKEDNYIINKSEFKFISNDNNTINILFYDFSNELYYKNPIPYTLNSTNVKSIYDKINILLENINNLSFTSGSFIKDIIIKFKIIQLINDKKKMIALSITFIIIILSFIFLYFCR